MEKVKDLSEMLKSSKSKSKLVKPNNMVNKFKNLTVKDKNFVEQEEFPKLRKPKEATLQKIRANQKKRENVKAKEATDPIKDSKVIDVPLRQEFLIKKQEIEKATNDLLQRYENHKLQNNMLLGDEYGLSTEDAQPLTLNKKDFDIPDPELNYYINKSDNEKSEPLNSEPDNLSYTTINKTYKNIYDILTYPEHLIYRIIYTKVSGHPNGFFADNIPEWYKKTFDKDLVPNWLEICKKSQHFLIENVQDKIVLYIRSEDDVEEISDSDINACGDINKEPKAKTRDSENFREESSVGFVRYKHLQRSLQDYNNYAGRKKLNKPANEVVKPTNKFSKINKKSLKK